MDRARREAAGKSIRLSLHAERVLVEKTEDFSTVTFYFISPSQLDLTRMMTDRQTFLGLFIYIYILKKN